MHKLFILTFNFRVKRNSDSKKEDKKRKHSAISKYVSLRDKAPKLIVMDLNADLKDFDEGDLEEEQQIKTFSLPPKFVPLE